jgi:hypothetical protein
MIMATNATLVLLLWLGGTCRFRDFQDDHAAVASIGFPSMGQRFLCIAVSDQSGSKK